MTNAFETYAEESKPAWQRRREETAERRRVKAKSRAELELEEQTELDRRYRGWKREQVAELLTGPYGREVKGLMSFLRTMTLSSAPALIVFVERAHWIRSAPDDVRHVVLGIVSTGIVRLREREGYPPFDDSNLGEPQTAFEVIRDLIRADGRSYPDGPVQGASS